MKNRILALLSLFLFFIFSSISVAAAEKTFTDVNNSDWFKENISILVTKGIIDGYPDGTFKPRANINVDAFIKLTVTALGYKLENGKPYWAQTYIDKAKALGLIEDDDFNSFAVPINRGQMAKIISSALHETDPDNMYKYKSQIKDFVEIPYYQMDAVLKAYVKGVITGYTDGSFKAANNANRAEASTMIVRLIDTGKRILPSIDPESGGVKLFPIQKNELYGYMDVTGKMVINPQFDLAEDFSDGLARVSIGEDTFFIDASGKKVFETTDLVYSFSEGIAPYRIKDFETSIWGYLDKQGNCSIQPQYTYASSFHEGLAAVSITDINEEEKWGFINKNGTFVIQPQFDYVFDFSEGLALVRIGDWESGTWGFVNTKGDWIVPAIYQDAWDFSEGLAPVLKDEKWGYIDRNGNMAIPPQFDSADCFSEGLAAVSIIRDDSEKYGFINKKGDIVIYPKFESVNSFNEGRSVFSIGDYEDLKYGFIDASGKIIVEATYDDCYDYNHGLTYVALNHWYGNESGYLDRIGNYVGWNGPQKVNITNLQDGSEYIGDLVNGVPQGTGKALLIDGNIYEGNWKDGIIDGVGTMQYPSGDSYSGEWENGVINGTGTYTWSYSSEYTGDWVNGIMEGEGTMTWDSGDTYTGHWENNNINGLGTYTWGFGEYEGDTYTGEWDNWQKSGFGTYTFTDGRTYVGEFLNDSMEGQGTMTWPDGSIYTGEFTDGLRNGQGKYTYAGGTVQEGLWDDDIFVGQIKEYTVDNVADFVNAIGSYTKIHLKPGVYNLTSLSALSEEKEKVSLQEVFDGKELIVSSVKNLEIIADGSDTTEIVVEPRYANILTFIDCKNIKISGIKAGHTLEQGDCVGGVLKFFDCNNFDIKDSYLYGCGTEGVNLTGCDSFSFTNLTIADCSYHIMQVTESQNISFVNSRFINNKTYDLVNLTSSQNVLFDTCEFSGNQTLTGVDGVTEYALFSAFTTSGIVVKDSIISNNTAQYLEIYKNSIKFENTQLDQNNFHQQYLYDSTVLFSKNGDIQITVPANWTSDTEISDYFDGIIANGSLEESLMTFSVSMEDIGYDYSIADIYENIEDMLQDESAGVILLDKKEITVNGCPGIQIVAEENSLYSEEKSITILAIIQSPVSIHEIIISTTKDLYQQNKEIYQEIINSFKEVSSISG